MKLIRIVSSILCFVLAGYSQVQFSTSHYLISTEKEPGNKALDETGYNFDNRINFHRIASEYFSWYVNARGEGSSRYMALPERTVPFDGDFGLGIQVEKNVSFLHLGIHSQLLGRAENVRPFYYTTADSSMIQGALSQSNVRWQIDAPKVDLLLDLTYNRLNYDLNFERWVDSVDDDGNTFVVRRVRTIPAIDDDLWTEFYFGIKPTEEIRFGLGTLLKNDFNEYGGFDYGDHRLGIEGDHEISMTGRKLFLRWEAYGHYRISEALYRKGDAEGMAGVVAFNPVFKLKKKFFIKANASYDFSEKMQKQWYEIALRKAFKNNSAIDLGYWTVFGSVFPRQALSGKMIIFIGPVVGIAPCATAYMRMKADGSYRYYRRTMGGEVLLNMDRFDIVLGYDNTFFENLKPFTSRKNVYLTLRKW